MTDPVVKTGASRRDFLKTSVVAGAAATHLAYVPSVHAAGSDVIKVGLVGCGGRGTGAAEQSINSSTNIKLHAMGDLFKDHLDNCHEKLTKFGDKVDVADDRKFIGFDAYRKVIDSGVDLVILATPPGFRPPMIKATIAAGKNLFCEKPVAVDGPGIRMVLAAAEEAKAKNLAVVAGTQRRHQAGYIEAMKRIPTASSATSSPRRSTGTRAGSGRSTGPRRCPTPSIRSATGSITPTSPATTSASSTSTTST